MMTHIYSFYKLFINSRSRTLPPHQMASNYSLKRQQIAEGELFALGGEGRTEIYLDHIARLGAEN